MAYDDGQKIMEQWFHMKFKDDLSDIRREEYGYYKYYVHNFVTSFFLKEKVEGKRILDFGCGPGFYSAILAQVGANVIGIDKSKFLIDKANEHITRLKLKNVEFYHGDLINYSSNFEDGTFDYIIAIDAIVSFDYDKKFHNHNEVVKTFRAVRRLLKKNGRFFIIESHPFFNQIIKKEITSNIVEYILKSNYSYKIDYKEEEYPHHWFTLDEMTKAISESGLAIFRIYEPDPSDDLKKEDFDEYLFRLKYPALLI